MKKTFIPLFTMLLLLMFGATPLKAQDVLTIYDGTTNSSYLPVSGSNLDYKQKSQLVYPADSLTDMIGREIQSMTFYSLADSTTWRDVINVSLATTTSDLTDGFLTASFTQVSSSVLRVVNNQLVVTFTTPFLYEGDNLLIQFDQPYSSGGFQQASFYGQSRLVVSGRVQYGYNYNTTSSNFFPFFLPKVTFEYEGLNTCYVPLNLTQTNVTTSSAAYSWTAGGEETEWIVEYGIKGFAHGTGTITSVNITNATLTGLSAGTEYDLYVRAVCSAGDSSDWCSTSFWTLPAPLETPFVEDFENETTNAFWQLTNNANTSENIWYIGDAVNNGGDNALYVSNDNGATNAYSGNQATAIWAYRDIYFSPAEGYELSFDWRCSGEDEYDFFQVHIVSPELNVDQIVEPTDLEGALINPERCDFMFSDEDGDGSWHHAAIPLPDEYLGETMRLYFLWVNDVFFGEQPPAAIDNISITHIACADAQLAEFGALSSTEFRLTFERTGDYEIVIATENVDPDSTTGHITISNTNTYIFTNLEADTTYFIYVKKLCGDEEAVNWINHRITMPRSILTVPFTIDFEDADINAGFNIANNDAAGYPNNWYIGDAQAFESDHALYISDNGGESATYQIEDATCVVYAYQDVYFPLADSYTVSLDVKIGGDASSFVRDALMVSIDDPRPTHAGYGDYDLIWNNIFSCLYYAPLTFQGDGYLVDNYITSGYGDTEDFDTTWIHYTCLVDSFDFARFAGKVQRLYLVWFNDESYGTQPSVIVDNISITAEGIVEPITPGDTTSISDRNLDLDVLLYPNPTTDVLHISAAGYQQYEIFNFVGQNVLSGSFTDGAARISTANLTPGVYFVRLDGRTTRKFVKR